MEEQSYAKVRARVLFERAKEDQSLISFNVADLFKEGEAEEWKKLSCAVGFQFYNYCSKQPDVKGGVKILHLGKGKYQRVSNAVSRTVGTRNVMEF